MTRLPSSQKLLEFDTLTEGQRVYVLGRGRHGTVEAVRLSPRGNVRKVEIRFDDGGIVGFSPRQLSVVASDVPAPEGQPPPRRRPFPVEPVVVQQAPAVTVRRVRRTVERKPAVSDPRPTPVIPGPPVPKPKMGVWETD